MNRINSIILTFIAITALAGCDLKNNTPHPDEGSIVLTMDWANIESEIPSTYQAYFASASGHDMRFNNLSGASNNLVI